eukprot:COSAG02_NODE_37498_length_441_cov_0.845029_1_plen_30_part_10
MGGAGAGGGSIRFVVWREGGVCGLRGDLGV